MENMMSYEEVKQGIELFTMGIGSGLAIGIFISVFIVGSIRLFVSLTDVWKIRSFFKKRKAQKRPKGDTTHDDGGTGTEDSSV